MSNQPTQHPFQPGDLVIVLDGVNQGRITEVLQVGQQYFSKSTLTTKYDGVVVDIPTVIQRDKDPYAIYEPDRLKPYYDGHEPCSWEDSIWKPTKEGVTC